MTMTKKSTLKASNLLVVKVAPSPSKPSTPGKKTGNKRVDIAVAADLYFPKVPDPLKIEIKRMIEIVEPLLAVGLTSSVDNSFRILQQDGAWKSGFLPVAR